MRGARRGANNQAECPVESVIRVDRAHEVCQFFAEWYNNAMIIILLFIALSVWSAEQHDSVVPEDFCIPSRWSRPLRTTVRRIELQTSNIQNLERITILRYDEKEHIHIVTTLYEIHMKMDCTDHDLNGGNIFGVEVSCMRCCEGGKGYVLSSPLSRHDRRFLVSGPEKQSIIPVVDFDNKDTHSPKDFCEYFAEKERFTVIRYLCEYPDLSRVFVRAQVTYDSPDVVINWGRIDTLKNTVIKLGKESEKKFKFAVCAPGTCRV